MKRFAGLLAGYLVTTTLAIAAPSYQQIIGEWKSNYGPIHVDLVKTTAPVGSADIKGYWMESPTHRGEITKGQYNSQTKVLELNYVETWTKLKGSIKLKLDPSGKKFTGNFKSADGSTGTWTWTR